MLKNRKIFYLSILAVGIAGVLDTLFLSTFTNIDVGVLFPGGVGSILIIYVYLKLRVRKGLPLIPDHRARSLVSAVTLLFAFSFVVIEVMLISNSYSNERVKTNYMIILGSGVKGETVSLTLEERLIKGIDYLVRYPDTKVVVSGGQGRGENISEAEAMKRYLISKGIHPQRIIMEDKSTSTMENFKFSKAELSKNTGRDITKVMIVTSDFHMLRSKMLARRNGFEAYGITCSTPVSVVVNCYAREYLAIIKSFFLDM